MSIAFIGLLTKNELASLFLGAKVPVSRFSDAFISDERRSESRRHGKAEGIKVLAKITH